MDEDRKNGSPAVSPRRASRSRSRSPRHRTSRSPSPRRSPPPRSRRTYGNEVDKKDSTSLFVGNLPGFWGDRELEELFEKVGKLVKVTYRRNKEGLGYGFVEFAERSDAEEAVKRYSGHVVEGNKINLDFDVGLEKKRRRRYGGGYAAPYARRSGGYRRSPRRSRSRSRSPRRRRSYSRSPPRRRRSYSRSRSRSRSRSDSRRHRR